MFDAQDVLFAPRLKKNLLSVSVMEEKGFVVIFRRGQVLIHEEGANTNTSVMIGVREGNLYKL